MLITVQVRGLSEDPCYPENGQPIPEEHLSTYHTLSLGPTVLATFSLSTPHVTCTVTEKLGLTGFLQLISLGSVLVAHTLE